MCSHFKNTATPPPRFIVFCSSFSPKFTVDYAGRVKSLLFLCLSLLFHFDLALRQLCHRSAPVRFETTCKPPWRGTAHAYWVAHERLKQPETPSSSPQLTFILTRIIHGHLVHPQSSLLYRRAYSYFANYNGNF